MVFTIDISQSAIDVLCDALLSVQIAHVHIIRALSQLCKDEMGYQRTKKAIFLFNKRQQLLQKLITGASEDFKKQLGSDDLKLWEELSLEKRGLAEPEERKKNRKKKKAKQKE